MTNLASNLSKTYIDLVLNIYKNVVYSTTEELKHRSNHIFLCVTSSGLDAKYFPLAQQISVSAKRHLLKSVLLHYFIAFLSEVFHNPDRCHFQK